MIIPKLQIGRVVTLYKFDLSTAPSRSVPSAYAGVTKRYSPYTKANGNVMTWGSDEYPTLQIELTDLKMTSNGTVPEPKLTIVDKSGSASFFFDYLNKGGNFVGVTVHRYVVPSDALGVVSSNCIEQVFIINQLYSVQGHRMVFSLGTCLGIDTLNEDTTRKLSSDQCGLKYRAWDPVSSSFKYIPEVDGGCPWGQSGESSNYPNAVSPWGNVYFTSGDAPTANPALDRCSKTITGCQARFPNTGNSTDVFPIFINAKGGTKGT